MSVFFYECFRLRERERSYLLGAVSEAKGMEKESFGVKKRESECDLWIDNDGVSMPGLIVGRNLRPNI